MWWIRLIRKKKIDTYVQPIFFAFMFTFTWPTKYLNLFFMFLKDMSQWTEILGNNGHLHTYRITRSNINSVVPSIMNKIKQENLPVLSKDLPLTIPFKQRGFYTLVKILRDVTVRDDRHDKGISFFIRSSQSTRGYGPSKSYQCFVSAIGKRSCFRL